MNKELLLLRYKNRIDRLTKRDEIGNHALIQKTKRLIRKVERENADV